MTLISNEAELNKQLQVYILENKRLKMEISKLNTLFQISEFKLYAFQIENDILKADRCQLPSL